MTKLTILVTVDSAGKPHCTPVVEKKQVEITWEMATPGWEIDDLIGLSKSDFPNQKKDGKGFKSNAVHPAGSGPTDHEYLIAVKSSGAMDTILTSERAVIRNDPG